MSHRYISSPSVGNAVLRFGTGHRSWSNSHSCPGYLSKVSLNDLTSTPSALLRMHRASDEVHGRRRDLREVRSVTGKVRFDTFRLLFGVHISLLIALDSQDPFTTLETQRNFIDLSVRADVNCIQFVFETGRFRRIYRIPGSVNLCDPGTKPDSPLTQALQLMQHTGRVPIHFPKSESSLYDHTLGQGP